MIFDDILPQDKCRSVTIIKMEEDSVENTLSEQKSQREVEGEAEGGMEILMQGPEVKEGVLQISEELRAKFSQTLGRFNEQMKAFREGQKNTFRIENPHEFELYHVLKNWKSRPCKNEKFLLHLELADPKIPLELVRQLFELFPSIVVHYGEEKLQNNGVLATDGEFFYEGNEKIMCIYSETRETDYEGEVMNRQMHGQGALVCRAKKGGFIYKGSFFEGKYHGTGELRNSKNVVYMGDFKNDFKDGHGVEMTMKRKKNPGKGETGLIRKSMYNGQFKEGFRCGEGVEETPHGVYRGEWRDGVKCGKGEIDYKNGDKYEGEWQNGEFQGEGTYVEKGNCTYSGSFQQGKYHGQGVMEYENGDKYEGQFERGKKHGQGIYTWVDGDYYDGEWKNDSAEGHGTSMLGTDFYDGEFKNGKRHGEGELTNEEGDVIKAIWENNQIIKEIQRNGQPV